MFAVNSACHAYREKIESYSDQLGKTDDINQLQRILGVLMRDSQEYASGYATRSRRVEGNAQAG